MSNRSIPLTDSLYEYLLAVSLREPALLAELRAETARDPENVQLQIAPEQGQLMAFMVRLMGARRCLELGVFTGYSSLVTALALPEDGRLVACDISEEWTQIARRYWQEAGIASRITLRLAPAMDTLAALIEEGAGTFDFAFIDADKESYDAYYEAVLTLLRPGGLMALDNMMPDDVWDEAKRGFMARAVHPVNLKIRDDRRVDASPATIGAGMMLARKR
jgi:predicted O-methyltransferase YrrM